MRKNEAGYFNSLGHDLKKLYEEMNAAQDPEVKKIKRSAFISSAYSLAEFLTFVIPNEDNV